MKKLNLDNNISQDDEKLINLLKTYIGQEPSKQFVENTLDKFLITNSKQTKEYKVLKAPLYIMSIIGLILFTPIIFLVNSQIPMSSSAFELKNLIKNISFQMNLWYTTSFIILLSVTMSVIWLQLSLSKSRKTFA